MLRVFQYLRYFMTMDEMYRSIFINKPWNFDYDGYNLEINVRERESEHTVKCSYRMKGNYKEAYASIFHLFNELVWFYGLRICNINGGHSAGSHVSLNYTVNSDQYLLSFKQEVREKLQHLALAFFREAECNESPYYRFMCFAKIVEIPFKKDQQITKKEWVEGQLSGLKSKTASTFRDRKMKSLADVSLLDWLYKYGRHAIAHARYGEIIRDPNNYDDWDEIKWANEIMQELAEAIIIQKLRVPKDHR